MYLTNARQRKGYEEQKLSHKDRNVKGESVIKVCD
jgi:hypothetical protein